LSTVTQSLSKSLRVVNLVTLVVTQSLTELINSHTESHRVNQRHRRALTELINSHRDLKVLQSSQSLTELSAVSQSLTELINSHTESHRVSQS
jgi:hypothetical protein